MKVVSITCYFDPHYVRSRVFEHALAQTPGIELVTIRNSRRGLSRFFEVTWMLVKLRFNRHSKQPDIYWLNFRGYELLPLVLLLAGRKPVIFDEMINPVEVLTEHRKQRAGTPIGTLMGLWTAFALLYYWLLKHCSVILADTEAHKHYTASLSHVPLQRYKAVPIGTDETVFKPREAAIANKKRPAFQVFYYGSMVPLHGAEYLIAAAEQLKDIPEITFLIAGKSSRYESAIAAAVKAGARITRRDWIEFATLPNIMHESAICIGGPLGGTVQSQFVITTKTYQSLACGALTLVGSNEATNEFFRDKANALVVTQADRQALATAILWAYENQSELSAIAAHGHQTYERHFSSQSIQQAMKSILAPFTQ